MKIQTVGSVLAAHMVVLLVLFSLIAPIPARAQGSNGYFFVHPGNCFGTAATTAFDSQALIRAAAGNIVLNLDTNTTGGTVTVTCSVSIPGGLAGRTTINSIELLYGVQTTALSSIATAVVSTVTYPASTAAGVAAAGTVATAAGGTQTQTPTALQLTATTTGQCFHERIALATPIPLRQDQRVTLEQVFTTAGTTETILQVCGVIVQYSTRI